MAAEDAELERRDPERIWPVVGDETGDRTRGRTLSEALEDGERRRIDEEALFRSAPFPLYGLPRWYEGHRYLGGSYASGMDAVALSLLHGSRHEGEPALDVETSRLKKGHGGGPMRVLADIYWDIRDADPVAIADRLRAMDLEPASLDDVSRSSERISVDGATSAFAVISRDEDWVARTEVDGRLLTIDGWAFPLASVELVRIDDVLPYVEGSRLRG